MASVFTEKELTKNLQLCIQFFTNVQALLCAGMGIDHSPININVSHFLTLIF